MEYFTQYAFQVSYFFYKPIVTALAKLLMATVQMTSGFSDFMK